MTVDRPYTDDDLRAEAARQHRELAEDPDFIGIGEQMEDAKVPSRGHATWRQLLPPEFDDGEAFHKAQRAIDDLLTKAVDISQWAIDLGADGLEPDGHRLQLGVDPGDGDRPQVRLHFAFAPDMPPADRDRFVIELSKAIAKAL